MEIKRFGRIREVIPLPPLTEIQVESYRRALQADVPPEKRENVGIQAAFRETFPIEEEDKGKGGLVLDFLEYRLGEPPFPQDECREKDLTYQAPLYARLQLIHKDTGLIKEDEVFLGHIPLMTEDGSFIINGADRVIVSQIHRSPGVYFTPDPARPGRYIASIIPLPKRGPWIDLEVEPNGVVSMKVNKRKFPLVLLLRVLGYDQETLARELGAYGELVQGLMDESVFAMRGTRPWPTSTASSPTPGGTTWARPGGTRRRRSWGSASRAAPWPALRTGSSRTRSSSPPSATSSPSPPGSRATRWTTLTTWATAASAPWGSS